MIALVSAVAFPTAAVAIWAALRSPLAGALVVKPSGERWSTKATPALGGIGVFTGILAGVGVAIAFGAVEADAELLSILGGLGLLFAVGLLDDVLALPPLAKLATQLGA